VKSSRPLALLAAGLLAFGLGAALACTFLPEWRTGALPELRVFRSAFRQIAHGMGFHLARGEPHLVLETDDGSLRRAYSALGEAAPSWLAATRSGVLVNASQAARLPGTGGDQELETGLSLAGQPIEVRWIRPGASPYDPVDREIFDRTAETFERRLLGPRESLGALGVGGTLGPQSWRLRQIVGSSPPQQVFTLVGPPTLVASGRRPAAAPGEKPENEISRGFLKLLLLAPWALTAGVIFLFLLLRSRIDLVNGAVLAALALASVSPQWLEVFRQPLWSLIVSLLFGVASRALWIFFVWSAGESLLRATRPDFTTSLDSLLRGRLGPRGGRALLLGCALGGGLSGARLAAYALAVALPGLSPAAASLALPVFSKSGSPVMDGLWLAAGVTLATAVAGRFLPSRWVLPAAALLAGFGLSPLKLFPFPVELAANLAFAGVMAWICRRFGLTTLIVASAVSFLLPAALYSGLHADWLPGSFGLTLGITAGLVLAGVVGLARPEEVEAGVLPPPAFMRRLAHERRLQHEVDLLARMQVGLLPQEMPRVEGYQIAARSVLASEAGGDLYDFLRDEEARLWIAAGDVAGHGYSCAVAQAMVKAGLLSLIAPEESPAGVLRQLDRVLRGVNAEHSFTSLALVRLDPATGEATLANAGHPYPLVFSGGRVTEIDLPGLPLGQGPARPYEDRAFELPRGGVLLLCSDGLFETLDRNGNAYGFDRAREVLQAMGHRPAVEIVEAHHNDCRRHLGAEQPPDDVTVVVVKRGS
jgi:sigma-B regulation protein RsbU (phosphoserine phosphatase)